MVNRRRGCRGRASSWGRPRALRRTSRSRRVLRRERSTWQACRRAWRKTALSSAGNGEICACRMNDDAASRIGILKILQCKRSMMFKGLQLFKPPMQCIAGLFTVAGMVVSVPAAMAQGFPSRPIRNVVPWPPGAPLDVIARALSTEVGRRWGQPVVVENRAGAASIIGAEVVAKAAPDGYTWMVTPINPSVVGNRFLYKSLPFDPDKSFAPVSLLAQSSQLVVVHPSVP